MGILSNFMNLNRYEILARIVIILLVLPLHEFAHGWVARKCGDDTAEAAGRLTLNPLAHVDPFGAVLLLLTGFGWAKPVPINPARMNHPRKGIIWTSLAGPLSNLLAALVGVVLMQIVFPFYYADPNAVLTGIYTLLYWFVAINISLAVFNLIPVPPLDGSKVLMMLLPYRQSAWLAGTVDPDSGGRTEHTAELSVQLDHALLRLGDPVDRHAGADGDVSSCRRFRLSWRSLKAPWICC